VNRLILASSSPRRRQLLEALGRDTDRDIEVVPADIDETPRPGESARYLVERLALTKARTIADRLTLAPTDIVIGADTIVTIDDDVLGKPSDDPHAAAMLARLSGRSHQVMTGVALVGRSGQRSFVETTTVRFAELSDADIDAYVASGEPRDKAGAYGIQGGAGRFVLEIRGSYQNIVGLPVAQLSAALQGFDGQ